MRLTKVEVRNFRSIFEESSTHAGLKLEIANGLNVLVGKNNCGKSNVFRAIAAALDPAYEFKPQDDIPGPIALRYPSIQVWFTCDPANESDRDLLNSARDYERSATKTDLTRADRNQIVLRVSWAPTDGGYDKRDRLVFLDGSDDPGAESSASLLAPVVDELRAQVRFVLVSSGESIKSVLEGNFREILHSVVREQLWEEFAIAEQHRKDYVEGLESELLGPLRDEIGGVVERLFPRDPKHLTRT